SGELALAEFYHRRLRPADEIKTLSLVANAPPIPAERLTSPADQQSWRSFDRIFGVIQEQGLPKEVSIAQYQAWAARYPHEQSLYARFLQLLVSQKEYAAAGKLIAEYSQQLPSRSGIRSWSRVISICCAKRGICANSSTRLVPRSMPIRKT